MAETDPNHASDVALCGLRGCEQVVRLPFLQHTQTQRDNVNRFTSQDVCQRGERLPQTTF